MKFPVSSFQFPVIKTVRSVAVNLLPAKVFSKSTFKRLETGNWKLETSLGLSGYLVSFYLLMCLPFSSYAMSEGFALYFTFKSPANWPVSPSSLLIQSPSFIKVPAGAVLSVHLLRDEMLVSTSRLTFSMAYDNEAVVPPVPVASFVPIGGQANTGQPLPGASLMAGVTDLTKVSKEPDRYKLMWVLSAGIMGTPGRVVATGPIAGFIDLNYSAVTSASIMGDQKPGSVLFYNRYTSSASNPIVEDTKLSIANTNPASSVFINMFLIDSATCEVSDFGFCLLPQQSISVNMSDLDPGVKGYAMAVAVNPNGEPVQFNWLVGNAIVKQTAANIGRPYSSVLSAYAVAKRTSSSVVNNGGLADMIFDDFQYDRLPGQIAFDSVPSQVNALNATTISVYRPLPDLTAGVSSINIQLTGWGVDSQNQVVSSSGNLIVNCYRDFTMAAVRLMPMPIDQFLPAGTTAWFIATPNDQLPLFGTQINSGEYNSGSNARALSFTQEYRIKIPVKPVVCP